MTQLELAKLAKDISKMHFCHWWDRPHKPEFDQMRKCNDWDKFYSYVINDWILKQPDRDSLMSLFIMIGFDMMAFFKILVAPPKGQKPMKKAA